MVEQRIAPQIEFKSLEDFIRGQNNFFCYFLEDCQSGEVYRRTAHFQRFQRAHPDLEREVTNETILAARNDPGKKWKRLPYNQLWEAYKIMSKLVFIDDPEVMRDGQPDEFFLVR